MQLAGPAVPVRGRRVLEHHRGLLVHLAAGGPGARPGLLLQAELYRAGRDVQLPGRTLLQVSYESFADTDLMVTDQSGGERGVCLILVLVTKIAPLCHRAVVSEWLRSQTRNLMGFARTGSNPVGCEKF